MKNIVIPILGAVSIVSTGAVAWLLATPPSVDPRVIKLESELKEARQSLASLKAELAKKPTAAVPTISSAGNLTLNQAPDVPADKQNLREMFNSPAMREVIDKQQAAQIEVGYAQLFEHLQLSPEERTNFKELLTARQKVLTDMSLQLMDPNLTPEKRQALIAEVKQQRSVYDALFKKFLNDENDWKTFSQWENTQPERTQYDTMGRSLFSASSEPLSQPQEQQLLNLMSEVRQSPYSVGGLNDQTGTDPTKLTDEVIEQQLRQLETNHQVIAERAQAFLSPGQQQTLQAYLNQLQTMSRSSIEMSKMILRGANK